MDNIKIQGVLTSRIETKNKGEPYYYGFFKIKNHEGEFPVIFKTKPDLKKGSQVQLTDNWANSNNSRPSFTCSEYQILSTPLLLPVKLSKNKSKNSSPSPENTKSIELTPLNS